MNVQRSRTPVVVVLGIGILCAGAGALARQVLPPWASFSRAVDDQRNSVAKPEVRDAAEEEVGQQDGVGPTTGPALTDVIPPRAIECWSFFAVPMARLDARRRHGRTSRIRGPPRHV